MTVTGKYNNAEVFTETVEPQALQQIYHMLGHPAFADTRIAVMPDVHFGKGSVVGFTMEMNGFVCPWVIGVDIGCGIDAYNLGEIEPDLPGLDGFIRRRIPSGFNRHPKPVKDFPLRERIEELAYRMAPDKLGVFLESPGTLGGGNHFIELNRGNAGYWLVIHSGSRHLGVVVADGHARRAQGLLKSKYGGAAAWHDLPYFEGDAATAYLEDMKTAQEYAVFNRRLMAERIIGDFFELPIDNLDRISSIHNYINFEDQVVRKGAIAAHPGQPVIIPLNMRDGSLIAEGKGNPEWNNSAPHGAGRIMSRGEAKRSVSLEAYEKSMEGVYTTSVGKSTIDESPFAYKPMEEIVSAINPTVSIRERILPVYNFKAG